MPHSTFARRTFLLGVGLLAALAIQPASAATKSKAHSKSQPAPAAAAATPAAKPATAQPAAALPVGQPAPDFTLTDPDGKTWHLADLTAQHKIVVLEWFSPICPVCEAYYKQGDNGAPSRIETMQKAVGGEDLVWLDVNSGAPGHGGGDLAQNQQTRQDWHVAAPILLDPTGATGHAFNAKRTPTICIIAPNGQLAYRGAPEDDPISADMPAINFVYRAMAQLRAKQPVTITDTLTYG